MNNSKEILILGAGTWGIALARMLSLARHNVQVWSALPEEIHNLRTTRRHINLHNMTIPDAIDFTDDITIAVKDKDILLFAVSSVYIRSTAHLIAPIYCGQVIVDVAKGIETDSLMTMSEVIKSEIPNAEVVALSGPTHAEEVALDLPTTIVSACEGIELAEYIQKVFSTSTMCVYTNTDINGAEVCGA